MGTGGMRYGAGRPGWHVKAENCLRLDIQDLARRKLLGGAFFTWRWSNSYTGEEVGSIGIATTADCVRLNFNSNGEPIHQELQTVRTPCHFGGSRPWWQCPRCRRRVGVLYLRNSSFMCRRCGRVAYASQTEDEMGRAWRKQRKAERQLGENWQRPKGMHRRTFEKLINFILDCEEQRDAALVRYMVKRFPAFARR